MKWMRCKYRGKATQNQCRHVQKFKMKCRYPGKLVEGVCVCVHTCYVKNFMVCKKNYMKSRYPGKLVKAKGCVSVHKVKKIKKKLKKLKKIKQ